MGEHCCPQPLLELVGVAEAAVGACCDEATALVADADADAMMFCEDFAAADRAVGLRRNLILALVLVFYQSMAIMQ